MADTNELKPCPFCGGKGYASERTCDKDSPYNPNDRAYPVVRCSKCFTTVCGKDWSSVSTAIEAWNKRATATPPADAALPTCDVAITWRDLFDKLAMDIGCLPSSFLDGNAHVFAAAAALRARAVPDGMALVDINLIDDEWMKAAMRDAGIFRTVGAPPETIIRAAISGYLLAASKEGK